jgi:hypothetical protein
MRLRTALALVAGMILTLAPVEFPSLQFRRWDNPGGTRLLPAPSELDFLVDGGVPVGFTAADRSGQARKRVFAERALLGNAPVAPLLRIADR